MTRWPRCYLVFDDRIELVRVLHGAREVGRILDANANGDEQE